MTRVPILCPGPSLRSAPQEQLHSTAAIAINDAVLLADRPRCWLYIDPPLPYRMAAQETPRRLHPQTVCTTEEGVRQIRRGENPWLARDQPCISAEGIARACPRNLWCSYSLSYALLILPVWDCTIADILGCDWSGDDYSSTRHQPGNSRETWRADERPAARLHLIERHALDLAPEDPITRWLRERAEVEMLADHMRSTHGVEIRGLPIFRPPTPAQEH